MRELYITNITTATKKLFSSQLINKEVEHIKIN